MAVGGSAVAVGKSVAVGRMVGGKVAVASRLVGGRVAVAAGVSVGAGAAEGGSVRVAKGGGVVSDNAIATSAAWVAGCNAVAETGCG